MSTLILILKGEILYTNVTPDIFKDNMHQYKYVLAKIMMTTNIMN